MAKKATEKSARKAAGSTRTRARPVVLGEEERVLREAMIHLIRKHGGLLVATGLREEHANGARQWIIRVTLRYPTGQEGYVGDLLYDGKSFSFLTPPEVREERTKKIAADPEGMRQWNEYRASTLRAE